MCPPQGKPRCFVAQKIASFFQVKSFFKRQFLQKKRFHQTLSALQNGYSSFVVARCPPHGGGAGSGFHGVFPHCAARGGCPQRRARRRFNSRMLFHCLFIPKCLQLQLLLPPAVIIIISTHSISVLNELDTMQNLSLDPGPLLF